MPHFILLEPWTPGILESLIWINSFGDDPHFLALHSNPVPLELLFESNLLFHLVEAGLAECLAVKTSGT